MAFSGCVGGDKNANSATGPQNSAQENVNSARSNIEELGMLVNIPYDTEDIVWKETPDRKQLIAVMRFSNEDADKIVAEAATHQTPQPVKLSSETWFPAELIAQSEMSGDDSINGLAYSPDRFAQEPYSNGRIVRVEGTNYFLLELSAK
ncbi:MAG: hypothetical protein ACKVRN_12620 [Pyrinomonadaceae bacterium]